MLQILIQIHQIVNLATNNNSYKKSNRGCFHNSVQNNNGRGVFNSNNDGFTPNYNQNRGNPFCRGCSNGGRNSSNNGRCRG